ncbi:hypothetical protein [Nonlabens antarcticus]|uniref:hypothetical protein n=1 Tax=Nonlabens antarcticus TaxID=392714 RepID=UPI0018913D7F|nr:hypothetical protein [Nonlabens antarcticus]
MKKEVTQLHSRLKQLQFMYDQNQDQECESIQLYFKTEYAQITARLKTIEEHQSRNNQFPQFLLADVLQTAGILGMYVMV